MDSETEEAAMVLERAADILETHGWIRGQYSSDQGYCALGAIYKAETEISLMGVPIASPHWVAHTKAGKAIRDRVRLGAVQGIADWNDNRVQSASEVIDTFKSVAKDLRNEA